MVRLTIEEGTNLYSSLLGWEVYVLAFASLHAD